MTSDERTAIVFGKGRAAITAAEELIRNSYRIPFVVTSTHELSGDLSFGNWAREQGIKVSPTNRLDELPISKTDLGISVYFDQIFRQRHIERFRILLNVHNSLLPKYRGVRPINWALKNNETNHGVTLHLITPGIDEGHILAQDSFPIDPAKDEVRDVYWRCISTAQSMLVRDLPKIWELSQISQVEARSSYYSSADDEKLGDRRYWTRSDRKLD